MDEPFPIPRILRWNSIKSDQIIEGDYKGKFTENVHPYIIPTVRETKMDCMITFKPYTDEVKNNVLDRLKKELERATVLISNKDSNDDGDLGGNLVEIRVGDDNSPSTSKDAVGTSSPRNLHKRVAVLEEALLDIIAYIREKRLKKKEKDERQHEQVHMNLHELERNEKVEKRSKMDELATVVTEEEQEEEKKVEEEEMEEDKSQEESVKEAAIVKEEKVEKEAV
ncbi:101 kDa malaria antigen-like [Capsicum annuum]|uniref:101 kDa malaria antigen-like n=1 Tax=Capsicum annuum TaxID=4072 RepID=UPI001FB14DB6|nr:101 kDa malaria antigen-like [Capsicum annuum]